ncbi:MAG: hypothetical protein IJB97_06005 [Clostridia bacterium]|nr:hypothetical protein [Clostridia bacterium]
MYCRKCGQEIDPNVGYCKACEQNETFFSSKNETTTQAPNQTQNQAPNQAPVQPQAQPQAQGKIPVDPGSRKFGFGKALASTILGVIAYVVMAVAMGIATGFVEQSALLSAYEVQELAVLGIIITLAVFIVGGIFAIISLILGIISIKTFFQRKKAGCVKPIPTLVLGIVGTATAASAFLYGALTLLILMALFAFV